MGIYDQAGVMKKIISNTWLLCIFGCTLVSAQQQEMQQSTWHGFAKHSFVFDGRQAHVVSPVQALPGNPWVWRAYFPDWHVEMDSMLLSRGFHIAYIDCSDMFGSPEAMQIWDQFYEYLIRKKGFSGKPALEGVSRGGLYVYGWAKRNPGKVSCIYAEAPVLDFKTWPLADREGGKPQWEKLLRSYHFTDEEAMAFSDNPIDNLETLAAFKIPVIHVVCERDSVVPVTKNTGIFEANYKKYGGRIQVDYMTENLNLRGHHFTIANPGKYADFIYQNSYPVKEDLRNESFIHSFGSLNNVIYKLKNRMDIRVAFLGGSITQNPGWRDKVMGYLKESYPGTGFHFIPAGIASLGSVPHAFRLQTDVLDKGKVDLLFVEAAVNDLANKTPATQQRKAMEGIVRHALRSNPEMNIILMAFADEDKIRDYDKGITPPEVALHEEIAACYQLAFVNLAKEVQQRIAHREFTWKDDFRDLHPSPFGQEIYFQTIKALFKDACRKYNGEAIHNVTLPKVKYEKVYENGKYMSISEVKSLNGFVRNPNWIPADGKPTRQGFVRVPVLEGEHPGAKFSFAFSGNAIGIAVVSGPDAGAIQYRVDKGKPRTMDLYTQWSDQLHLPWYLVLADDLPGGKHILKVKIIKRKNKASEGNTCRIVHFLVNE